MRAGACTIQQALTSEAAAILKQSLSLARRRGHAQVTPLHVAATLLNSSSAASSLLRRACIRSRTHHPHSLHLQCRALELCFNVALNRLPTSPPPSSSPLHHHHPSLSNALIAALKRAQAHQRRGCIESQNSHTHQSQQQTNQPLLAVKVELEQLIISILDDPSVSRVMREAGFSSTSVKKSLEEKSTAGFAMAACSRPPTFFDNGGVFFPAQFMKTEEKKEEDVKVVLEVMLKKKHHQNQQPRKRAVNAVVVGDSASMAEGVVDELLMRLERGQVPEELRGAQVVKLQLSYVHLRLMSRIDVEMKISDLRRRVFSSLEKGVIVYAGDLRWAVGEEYRDGAALSGFKPEEYFVSEVGRFLSELKSGINGGVGGERAMVWVLAFSSYQTYMKCKTMNPCLESQWALQAVVVPSSGLALSLNAPCSGMNSVAPKLEQYQFQMLEHNRAINGEEEEGKLLCCAECVKNYEKEAVSVLKPETNNEEARIVGSSHLPFWLQNKKPENLYKENLFELRRKWNRLCRSLHHPRINQVQVHPPPLISKAYPWWTNNLPCAKTKLSMEPTSISLAVHCRDSIKQGSPQESNLKLSKNPIVTTLALSSPVITDSETSTDCKSASFIRPGHLSKMLQENIPWQSEMIHSVVNSLLDCRLRERKGSCILIHGNDLIAKRRLARVVAQLFSSVEGVLRINLRKSECGSIDMLRSYLEKESKRVVLIEGIECANTEFIKQIGDGIRTGILVDSRDKEVSLANSIFILSSASSETAKEAEDSDRVLQMSMRQEEEEEDDEDSALSDEMLNPTRAKKKLRTDVGDVLDLNVAIIDEGENGALSGLTYEYGAGGEEGAMLLPASAVFNFETTAGVIDRIAEGFAARLWKEFEETVSRNGGGGRLVVEQALAAELAAASGFFLEAEFDRWVREVFKIRIPTVKNGGKVRLALKGKEENMLELGYLCSTLPKKIFVH